MQKILTNPFLQVCFPSPSCYQRSASQFSHVPLLGRAASRPNIVHAWPFPITEDRAQNLFVLRRFVREKWSRPKRFAQSRTINLGIDLSLWEFLPEEKSSTWQAKLLDPISVELFLPPPWQYLRFFARTCSPKQLRAGIISGNRHWGSRTRGCL